MAYSAANVDNSWIGTNGRELMERKTGCPVLLINDADAAGIAEMEFGAGRGHPGIVIILTFGTGIGSAIHITQGVLDDIAEDRAADRIRKEKDLNWEKWAERVNEFLDRMEILFSPDLFIIGGGVSKKHEKYLPLLKTTAEIVPAQMLNEAGIIGAALAAKSLIRHET